MIFFVVMTALNTCARLLLSTSLYFLLFIAMVNLLIFFLKF